MKLGTPYLYFNGNAEEAFEFYRSVFGGEYLGVLRYRDFPESSMDVAEEDLDRIANIALPLGEGTMLMASDAVGSEARDLVIGSNVYIMLETDSAQETEKLYARLGEGGSIKHPLQRTEWAEKHAILVDRFGVQWMLNYTGEVEFSPADPT
jgi:PhnB protein